MTRPPIKPVILSCAGPRLTDEERALIARENPFGLIIFRRNIENPQQVQALTADFRTLVERGDAPVLIDQEGGRVTRFTAPNWHEFPAPARYGQLAEQNNPDIDALALTHSAGLLLGAECRFAGVTVDCAPMIDVPAVDAHAGVIGDRAFARDADRIIKLARAFADGLLEAGVLPVMKHIPGHGRATADSHLELPVVNADRATLEATDFAPFKALANTIPLAMTAHVLYPAVDPVYPATLSKTIITDIIRGHMGFDGFLMTDAIEMKALKDSLANLTRACLAAGNDAVLYCAGDMAGNSAVLAAAAPMTDRALARWARAVSMVPVKPAGFDPAAYDRLAAVLADLPETGIKTAESPVMD